MTFFFFSSSSIHNPSGAGKRELHKIGIHHFDPTTVLAPAGPRKHLPGEPDLHGPADRHLIQDSSPVCKLWYRWPGHNSDFYFKKKTKKQN